MSATGGILCVSVIEAKNVLAADTTSDLSFYVRLRLGQSEVKTDTCAHNIAPKFLKDVRLPVPSPATDVLQMDLLQLGPRGDLVVGSAELLVSSLTSRGTVVHWFDLRAFNQGVGAQLCCVLRYLSASSSRPATPSYAIATREARERAVTQAAPDTLQTPGPNATRALFSDADPTSSASKGAAKAAPAAATAAAATANGKPAVWAPATPAVAAPAARTSRSGGTYDSPTQSTPPAAVATPEPSSSAVPADGAGAKSGNELAAAPSKAETATAATTNGHAAAPPLAEERQREGLLRRIPAPLAMAGGLLIGVVAYVLSSRRPDRGESCDYDEVSLVSSCFNRSSYERYRQRRTGTDAR